MEQKMLFAVRGLMWIAPNLDALCVLVILWIRCHWSRISLAQQSSSKSKGAGGYSWVASDAACRQVQFLWTENKQMTGCGRPSSTQPRCALVVLSRRSSHGLSVAHYLINGRL